MGKTKDQYGEKNHNWNSTLDENEIVRLYVEEKHNMKYIAEKFGVSRDAIRLRLKKNDVKTRTFSEQHKADKENGRLYKTGVNNGEKNGSYIDGRSNNRKKSYYVYSKYLKNSCECCGISKDNKRLEVHHLDWNHLNNDESNLITVCKKCHNYFHFSPRAGSKEVSIESIEFTDEFVDMVDLEVEGNSNFILDNNLITHNSGKSYFLHALTDRLHLTGRAISYVNDVKDEMKTSHKPVQEKFRGGLLDGEKPKGIPTITLRPTFFKTLPNGGRLPNDNHWFSINFRDMSKADFMTMMNSDELSQTQRVAFEMVFDRVQSRLQKNKELDFSVGLLEDVIDGMEELNSTQRNALKFKVKPLGNSHFFERKFEMKVSSLVGEGIVPNVNMDGFDYFGRASFLFPQVLLNVVIKDLVNARKRHLLKELWIIFDEASRFIGNRVNTSVKQTVLESYDLDAGKGINWCLHKDTLVMTVNGSKKIKDLSVDDKVISWDFKNDCVKESDFIKTYTGMKKLFKIRLKNGKEVVASEEHIFFVKDLCIRDSKVKDIVVGDRLVLAFNTNLRSSKVVSVEEVGYDDCYDLTVPDYENFILSNRILSHNCSVFQNLSDVPSNILSQSRYIFVPATANTDTIKDVLLDTGVAKNIQTAKNQSLSIKKRLLRTKFSWMVADRNTASFDYVVSLPPLSKIMESRRN